MLGLTLRAVSLHSLHKGLGGYMRNKKRSLGYGLLEIGLGIAIAALLVAAGVAAYSLTSVDKQTADSAKLVQRIYATARSLYAGLPDYAGITSRIVASSNDIPRQYLIFSGATVTGIKSPFGSPVEVAPRDNNTSIHIKLYNLPQQACVYLLTKDMEFDYRAVILEGRRTVDYRPFTPTEATQSCQEGSINAIRWIVF